MAATPYGKRAALQRSEKRFCTYGVDPSFTRERRIPRKERDVAAHVAGLNETC